MRALLPLLLLLPLGHSVNRNVTGRVATADGRPALALVTARHETKNLRVSVLTDALGRYELPALPDGSYTVVARADGYADASHENVSPGAARDLTLRARTGAKLYNSSAWLQLLPDGDEKRRFVLDCTGCHLFNETRAHPNGKPRTHDEWKQVVGRMLGYAGATSGFPVISSYRDPQRTADWIAPLVLKSPTGPESALSAVPAYQLGRATITEYDMPAGEDLPHDVAVTTEGDAIVTGMFTHTLYRVDPASGAITPVPIPVETANPRALEIDSAGDWWVALGAPMKVARYSPRTLQWQQYGIGVYPHSIAPDDRGGAWFNGHFTHDPELIGRVGDGDARTVHVPPHPTLRSDPGGPIPYELRTGPDGRVWVSELQGNRVIAYDPAADKSAVYTMPVAHSGPRRFDIAADNVVWIPAYSDNALVRLADGKLESIPLPIADAVPYVVRVHPRTGDVWIGTSAADAVLRFVPATRKFTVYPLPSRGAMIRHMAFDARSGALWLAYGASPGDLPARVARLEPKD